MKRIIIAMLLISLSISCVGCSSDSSSSKRPNVVGMTLADACVELYDAGWAPHPVDETPYSDYVPGAWENGVRDYDDCKVTRVEFSPSESAGRGYATASTCKVYFESNSQPQQETLYDLDVRIWLSWYDMLTEELAVNGATEETVANINQAYNYILDYDEDKVPTSRKDVHQQILGRFQALLDLAS